MWTVEINKFRSFCYGLGGTVCIYLPALCLILLTTSDKRWLVLLLVTVRLSGAMGSAHVLGEVPVFSDLLIGKALKGSKRHKLAKWRLRGGGALRSWAEAGTCNDATSASGYSGSRVDSPRAQGGIIGQRRPSCPPPPLGHPRHHAGTRRHQSSVRWCRR